MRASRARVTSNIGLLRGQGASSSAARPGFPVRSMGTWHRYALCQGSRLDFCEIGKGGAKDVARARAVCARCPAFKGCVAEVFLQPPGLAGADHGVYAGLTGRERRAVRRIVRGSVPDAITLATLLRRDDAGGSWRVVVSERWPDGEPVSFSRRRATFDAATQLAGAVTTIYGVRARVTRGTGRTKPAAVAADTTASEVAA